MVDQSDDGLETNMDCISRYDVLRQIFGDVGVAAEGITYSPNEHQQQEIM